MFEIVSLFQQDTTEEEQEAREFAREKMVRFRAVTTLMMQKRKAAIERKIQDAQQTVRRAIYMPEEIEQQEAVKAVTDLAFPE